MTPCGARGASKPRAVVNSGQRPGRAADGTERSCLPALGTNRQRCWRVGWDLLTGVEVRLGSDLLAGVVEQDRYRLDDPSFRRECRRVLEADGVVTMPGFLTSESVASIRQEGEDCKHLAFYTSSRHNVYLEPTDPTLPMEHPRNREVESSKGCITTHQVSIGSRLRQLYDSAEFRDFLCAVLGEEELHEYGDPLSSINLHYAAAGQQLGWHFDNSSFAITLLVQAPTGGGQFEYVKEVRDADAGEMNYELAGQVLDGTVSVQKLAMDAGSLVLFRGRNSMHRVTPTEGEVTRMLAVLAYNTASGIPLSESARMTFFGRLA